MNATKPVYVHCGGVGPPCRSLCSATPNATAIAIVLDILLSIPIFHFIPSWSFIVGAPLVIVATVLYSLAPKNVFGLDDMDCPDPCPCFGGDKPKASTRPANETNKLLPGSSQK